MILAFDTEAYYISELGGKRRAADYYYMTNRAQKEFNNGAINFLSTITKHVMSSSSEAETGTLYYTCKSTIPYIVTLQKWGTCSTNPTQSPLTTTQNTASQWAL